MLADAFMLETLWSQTPVEVTSRAMETLFVNSYRTMLLARVLDDKLASLYRAGLIPGGGVYLGRGQEALSVSVGISLRAGDVYAPLIRDGAGRLAFGETVEEALRTCLGSALGPMRGRDGNVHRGRPRDGYLPMISHLGAMISVVNGTLMAKKLRGERGAVGATCIGEGGTSTGAFHEGLNQAAVERLPLVLVVCNNQYAYSTPTRSQFACRDLVERAAGYGVAGHSVDGTSLEECLRVVGGAVEAARQGGGPQLVVGRLLRLCGHGEHDDAGYVLDDLKKSALGRDCLALAGERIVASGWAKAGELERWRQECAAEVDSAVEKVQSEPQPDPYAEDWRALSNRDFVDGHMERRQSL